MLYFLDISILQTYLLVVSCIVSSLLNLNVNGGGMMGRGSEGRGQGGEEGAKEGREGAWRGGRGQGKVGLRRKYVRY